MKNLNLNTINQKLRTTRKSVRKDEKDFYGTLCCRYRIDRKLRQ